MRNIYLFFLALFTIFQMRAQLIINELDSDTPGVDTQEFVELKSMTPYFSLDGYVLAFFNGNTTSSDANRIYYALDLSGLTTDINGIVVIGNNNVSPVPSLIISDNTIQNGPDAVAIYQGSITDYQPYTLATTANLVAALAYSNNTSQATDLMSLLGLSVSYNENLNGNKDQHSIQRKADGTYEVKMPTPGANNDGSGVIYNGVTIEPQVFQINEADELEVIFRTSEVVTETVTLHFTLENGTFTTADYSSPLEITFMEGTDWSSLTVELLDDGIDEGDEEMKISLYDLPEGYVALNNNVIVRVVDINFTVADWGTPLNPTYGNVSSTQAADYYEILNNKSGDALKSALQSIIADPEVVRKHTYGDVVEILKSADQNPAKSSEVWLMYVEKGRSKLDYQLTSNSTGTWNREHIFPQSRGKFSGGTPTWSDGIELWEPTHADDLMAGHSDAHHIRAEDGPENSSRGNKSYGPGGYNGPTGTAGSWKGDVARSLFYMAIRYNALDLENGFLPTTTEYKMGDLDALLEWNRTDTADDFEMNRNNVVYEWQRNRNPFIDMPELAEYIWGQHVGEVWNNTLSIEQKDKTKSAIYPNPAHNIFYIHNLAADSRVEVYTLSGAKVMETLYNPHHGVNIELNKGVYLIKTDANQVRETYKLVVY